MNAEVRQLKTNAELTLADVFATAKAQLPGSSAVATARGAAFDRFSVSGLPHRRLESWKYTDLRSLMREAYPLALPPDAVAKQRAKEAGRSFAAVGARRLVVVDGVFCPDVSDLAGLESGLSVGSMAGALAAGDPLVMSHLSKVGRVDDPALALNTALVGDGVVIRVAARTKLERPLHLVFAATGDKPVAMYMRSLVVVEQGASATLIETYEGPAESRYQVNSALDLVVEDEARVELVKTVAEGTAAQHVGSLVASVGGRARFDYFSLVCGGALVRGQSFIRLVGEETCVALRGVSLLSGTQHADATLIVDHAAGRCESRELFKSVLDGQSRSVFQGRINVLPRAQKTDARMMTRALLLSDEAEADSKPELEIFADDVQCGHGSTSGALDPGLKFYLMARGIPAEEAEALLIQAFVGEVIDAIGHEAIRTVVADATQSWLAGRG
ncbi:MAG TPA: Fe-S cluster assembly protein SufD [Pseudolabrys sp.]|nr:Fe-S cluster assembly protein SufD [Pseudolabrys sp.]